MSMSLRAPGTNRILMRFSSLLIPVLVAWLGAPALGQDDEDEPPSSWETRRIELKFRVLDARSLEPIEEAEVRVSPMTKAGSHTQLGTTDKHGNVTITVHLPLDSEDKFSKLKRSVDFSDRWLDVAAENYKRMLKPLIEYADDQQSILPWHSAIVVKMIRGKSEEPKIGKFAGMYEMVTPKSKRSIWLQPEGTFYMQNDDGKTQKTYYGTAKIEYGLLKLTPSKSQWKSIFAKKLGTYHTIVWDKRRYLIEEEKLLSFAHASNHGLEPRTGINGAFLLRDEDRAKPTAGVPDMPEGWASKILKEPIEGSIVELLEEGKAKVNLGWRDGVWNGMELAVLDVDGKHYHVYEVLNVSKADCVLVGEKGRDFLVGAKVSSRLPAFALVKLAAGK
jgi:hypothetical protein